MFEKRLWVLPCLLGMLSGCGEYDESAQGFTGDTSAQAVAFASDGVVLRPQDQELIPNRYIVVFKEGMSAGVLSVDLLSQYGGSLLRTYHHALSGAVYDIDEKSAKAMAADPDVAWVEQDALSRIIGDQANPTWGIDRIDERDLPDDDNYHWDYDGSGVDAFILDTGIRTTHNNFGGRARWGTDCTGEGQSDGHGHGTHVAGTVGSTTYGVAKNVDLVAVKVCTSGGSCPNSDIICGVDYVTGRKNASPSTPMVANMSLGGGASSSIDNAVNNSINAGVFYAVAAGNSNANACNYSPARVDAASTVGATTSSDSRSSFSNFGTCVDIFAPGSSITSTWNTSNTATNTISGTSMASPHVCGAAALVFDEFSSWSPAQAFNELNDRATTGVVGNPGSGSPNRLLYTLSDGQPPPDPPPSCDNPLHNATFESGSNGWTAGSSTCTTGQFVVGTPDAVNNGGVQTQVGGAASGSGAYFTQPNTGGAGTDDVDGGTCEAVSPTINAAGAEAVEITLDYFHGQRDAGDDSTDGFVLDVLNNGNVVDTIVSIGDVTSNASWTRVTTTVNNPGQIQLRARATDGASAGDLVEAGLDNVLVCGVGAVPPPGDCYLEEGFESGMSGWYNSGDSTCSTGSYVVGTPTQESNGGVVTQVGGANTGANALFTAVNSSAGVDDVDGGNCILTSDRWTATAASTLSAAYFHGQRDAGDDSSGDFFRLEYSTNGGSSWNTLASNADQTSNAAWSTATAQIPGGSSVTLRVQCSDGAGPGDLVECGIDDVKICPN